MRILFFKATIPGHHTGNLFTVPVDVHGYTTAHGTFVAPHRAMRHKRPEEQPAPDLFAPGAQAPAPQPRRAVPTPGKPGLFVAPQEAPPPAAPPPRWDAPPIDRDALADMEAEGRLPFGDAEPTTESAQALADETLHSLVANLRDIAALDAEQARMRAGLGADKKRAQFAKRYLGDRWHQAMSFRDTLSEIGDLWGRAGAEEFAREAHRRAGTNPDILKPPAATDRPPEAPSPAVAEPDGGAPAEKPPAPAAEPEGQEERPAAEAAGDGVRAWGVAAGASKAERRKLNAAALALLEAQPDDAAMTAEDRQILARYTGRGGIGDSLNEFYTEPAVASAMWSMLANAGFRGGEVLEPSCGTGVFLHTAAPGARVTGVEIDPISSRIARILHGPAGHDVDTASLERFATQDGRQFDAVIGNVPFGLRGAVIRDDKADLATADQYFLDTALDKTKDGGLVALIVPTGIMDSRSGRAFRERILRKGVFLDAHRLPNTAFEGAHTGVTSDIVLFRKRPQDAAGALSTLTQERLQKLDVWDPEFLAGSYFTEGRGAGHVMGRMEEGWRAKAGLGHDITVTGSMAGVPAALATWRPDEPAPASPSVQQVLDALGDDREAKRRAVNAAMQSPYQVPKLGDTRVINGVRYILQGEPPRWHRAEDALPEAVEDARHVSEMIDDLAEGRARDPAFTRAALIEALDDYVRLHGVPSRNKALLRWLAAPSLAAVDGMSVAEHGAHVEASHRRVARLLGAVRDNGTYSDLVTGRTEHAEATLDTVATKLALETGGFTADQLATAWGHGGREAVLDHLYASPDYALDADGRTWTTLDSYLSGELWPKLDAMRELAAHDGVTPATKAKYERQAAALEEVIEPQSLDDVEVMVNSGFITPEILTAWLGARYTAAVAAHPARKQWEQPPAVTFDRAIYAVRGEGGGPVWGDGELLERILNRKGVKKDEQAAVERINREFREWLLGSDYRDRVEESYNRHYRGFRQRAYSDTPIAIPGLNPALAVNAYHFAGLRWALEAGKGIIAADVGLGKTGRGLMLARLAKVTGQAKRPTFVVPKSVLANWMAEAEFWFPGSKVLVIGETYSRDKAGNLLSKPDNEETRRRKYHDLQQNEYDFVFISMPAWNDLDVDPITKGEYLQQDFWVQRGDALGNAGDKRTNQIRTAYDQAKAKREFAKREGTIYFNDLGIDLLILDEGQAYKNLYAAKNRFGESPKFLGGSGLSNRAQDTYYKTKWVRGANGGKGVFMLTATPTKNSPLEVYSMLSHIAPEAFERMGIKNSEDFLDRFCVFENDTILGVSGDLEQALVTAGFKNLDELREVMRRYIDRKTAEDVGLVIPRADERQHAVDMTHEQEAKYQELRTLAASSGSDDTGEAHIFSIMDKMGKASLDLALLSPDYAGARSPKIDAAVAEVVTGTADGGQVVFCDSVPTHEKIVAALVAGGIPRSQIGVINAQVAPTSAQRQRVSDDFNAGKLKVVIGNTATMGEGVNLQKGTTDIHHLDLPWEPASVQQRNGRGRRQGNKNESIRIHTYLAKGSFDGYRWQTVSAKRDWMDLLWNGGDRVENLARQGGIGRQDMLIMLAANPDEARAKYAADKGAAEARKLAEDREKAADQFARLQQMRTSLAKLKASGARGDSVTRLEHKAEQLRSALQDNRHFLHKDLIDSAEPALVEPVSGHLWTKDKGFEVAPGPGSPIDEAEPTKWVVTGVDVPGRTISARRYGSGSNYPLTLAIDKMQRNVTPIEYSADAEAGEIEKVAAALQREGGERRAAGALESGNVSALKGIPADVLERVGPAVQQQIKAAIASYRDGHHQYYGLTDPQGNAVVATSYEARDMLGDHDVILPTAAGRRKAIEAYVHTALNRRIETKYTSTGRRGRGPARAEGIKGVYQTGDRPSDFASTNPWGVVLSDVFPPDVEREAKEELHRRVAQNVASAPDFRAAFKAALPAVHLSEWPGYNAAAWPVSAVDALRQRAERLGVTGQTMQSVVNSRDPAEVHPSLLRVAAAGGVGWTGPNTTVGGFLAALDAGRSPSGDAAEGEPAYEPEKEAA